MCTTVASPLSKPPGPAASGSAASAPVAVKSEALFVGASEVLIDHRGVMYRLRLTSLGKLILTK
jgi:hemin uptake protein HemP